MAQDVQPFSGPQRLLLEDDSNVQLKLGSIDNGYYTVSDNIRLPSSFQGLSTFHENKSCFGKDYVPLCLVNKDSQSEVAVGKVCKAVELTKETKTFVKNHQTLNDLDTGWSWVVMAACFGGQTICTGLLYGTGLIHIALLKKFRADEAQTTWASAVFISMMSFAGPFSSSLADKFSCRVAVIVSGLIFSFGFLVSAFAPNVEACIFSIGIVAGSGAGMAYTVLFSVNAYNFTKKLNIAQGMSVSGCGFGILVMPPIIQLVEETYGYFGLMLILAGIVLQLVVMGALMRPSKLELQEIRRRKQAALVKVRKKWTGCESLLVFLKVLSEKAAICLSVSMLLFCGGLYTVTLHLPNYAQTNGFTAMESAFFLSVIGIVTMISRLTTGMLAQHPRINEIWIYSGSIGVVALVTFLFPAMAHEYAGHLFYSVCIGIFGGCCYVVMNTINRRFVGVRYTAAACAVEFWFGGLGSVVVPVISGYVLSCWGQYAQVVFIGASCILLAAIAGGFPAFLKMSNLDDIPDIDGAETDQQQLKKNGVFTNHE